MKIVCEKGHDAREMLNILTDFIMEQTLEYPILKNDMEIEVTFKNDANQINPNNERVFYFGQKELDEREAKEESVLDFLLKEHWSEFISEDTTTLVKEIETDRNYISTAKENGRKPQNVENRKKALLKKEKRLTEKKEREVQLRPFIDMVKNKQVEYQYEKDEWGEKIKVITFEINKKTYTFRYTKNSWGMRAIYDDKGEIIINEG